MESPAPAFTVTPEQLKRLEAGYRRIEGFDEWAALDVDARAWERLQARRATLLRAASPEAVAEADRRLLRIAAYDTGALDGLYPPNPEISVLLAGDSAAVEVAVGRLGDGLGLVVDAQHAAVRLSAEVASSGRAVDEELVRSVHVALTAPLSTYLAVSPRGPVHLPVEPGVYKRHFNFHNADGALFAYCPGRLVPEEMSRVVEHLASDAFAAAHPVLQTAYATYALGYIHPFSDGNGRVARCVASVFLLRGAGVPLVVLADQWAAYLRGIISANHHRPQPWVDFVMRRTIDMVDLWCSLCSEPAGPALERLRRAAVASSPSPRGVLDGAAARLVFDMLWAELRECLVTPPDGVQLSLVTATGPTPLPDGLDGWRAVPDVESRATAVRLRLAVEGSDGTASERCFVPVVCDDPGTVDPVGVTDLATGELFMVAVADIHPDATTVVGLRLRAWLAATVGAAFAEVAAQRERSRPDR